MWTFSHQTPGYFSVFLIFKYFVPPNRKHQFFPRPRLSLLPPPHNQNYSRFWYAFSLFLRKFHSVNPFNGNFCELGHWACAGHRLCDRKNCTSSSNGKSFRNLRTSMFQVCRRGPRGSKSHCLRRYLTKHHACAEHRPRPHVTLAYSVKSQEQPLVGLVFCKNVKTRTLRGQCSLCVVSTADFRNVGFIPRYTIWEHV